MKKSHYQQALDKANKIGAANVQGEELLAQTIMVLCLAHRGANPELVFNGAIKKKLDSAAIRKLAADPVAFGDLMFV